MQGTKQSTRNEQRLRIEGNGTGFRYIVSFEWLRIFSLVSVRLVFR